MVAYSFKPVFVHPIRQGFKIGTIRALGKRRHARPGEMLQFYCGMRRPGCFKIIDDLPCLRVNEIEFDLTSTPGERSAILISGGVPIDDRKERDMFARADGFPGFKEMLEFWLETHGRINFAGVHIIWKVPRR